MHHDHAQPGFARKPSLSLRLSMGLLVLAALAGYFLLTQHRAHFFAALPFLLLLACPLMHLFMHRGHAGHAPQQHDKS